MKYYSGVQKVFSNKNIILPNLITILGLLCGLYAIIVAINGNYVVAAYVLILASVFDALDGKVARLVKGTSEFGIQLDSLCDLVSFGVAPALLVYYWSLASFGRIGIMAVFLYVAAGALRLARFNVQSGKISNEYFVGLPIPIAAAFIASSVLFVKEFNLDLDKHVLSMFFLVSIYLLAFLMVSSIPYYSFKKVSYFKEKPFNTLVLFVMLVFIVGLYFEVIFFVVVTAFIFLGVVFALLKLLRLRKKRVKVEG